MQQGTLQNYYETLQIPSDADEREIKRAYYRLARDLHPDKAGSPEELLLYQDRFAQVSAAYNNLKDPAKREEYDRKIKGAPAAGATMPRPAPTASAAVLGAARGVPASAQAQSAATSGEAPAARRDPSATQPGKSFGMTPEKAAIAQKAFAKGMQFYKEGNFVKAIEFFDAAIQNNDQEAVYFARLSTSLIEARRSATRALDAAQRAIDLDPYNHEHKFNLALIFEKIGSRTNAQRIYEDVLRWDPENWRAQDGLKNLTRRRFSFGAAAPGNLGTPKPSLKDQFQQLLGRFKSK